MSRQRIIAPLSDRESAAARSVLGLVQRGKKIQAIKEYRDATGRSLADSKDVIDALAAGTLVLDTLAPQPVLMVVVAPTARRRSLPERGAGTAGLSHDAAPPGRRDALLEIGVVDPSWPGVGFGAVR